MSELGRNKQGVIITPDEFSSIMKMSKSKQNYDENHNARGLSKSTITEDILYRKFSFLGDLIAKAPSEKLRRTLISKFNQLDNTFPKAEQSNKDEYLVSEDESNNGNSEITKVGLPIYISPRNLSGFLIAFNQNEVLRSTCHEIDTDALDLINKYCKTTIYNFQIHQNKILTEFKELENLHRYVPYKVKALIRGYLSGADYTGVPLKTGWSKDKIQTNWSSDELLNWSKNNVGIPPNLSEALAEEKENLGYEIARFKSKITGHRIENFRGLTIHFKNLFHIRRDNSLRDIINLKNIEENWESKIEFVINDNDFPSNIELFTDVDTVVQAYKRIIELILDKHTYKLGKPLVKLSFLEKDNKIYFQIHHQNSTYGKTLKSTLSRPYGQSYSNLIKKQINGLCNMSLKANFGQKSVSLINLWDGNPVKHSSQPDSFTGVEHTLEFYK